MIDLTEAMGARWYTLKSHPVQDAMITDKVRFKVVAAGRRSGKTERAKRHVIASAFGTPGLYFLAAPTYGQVKKIYWDDLKKFIRPQFIAGKSESDLVMSLVGGSEIHLIGLDKPSRFEGIPWAGGNVDEIADVKAAAIDENIMPALDTPGLDAWCMFTGVPDGLNHFYDLAEYAKGPDKDWKFYSWPSSDILDPKVIEAAKRRMSPKLFAQEYEASFETASGRIYEDYATDGNATGEGFIPGEIRWCHDFNFFPMSSAIIQTRGGADYVVDEIILDHATPRHAALEFVERYKDHRACKVLLYGDPSGRVGEKHGLLSNYLEIEAILRQAGFIVERRVFASTRSIRDGQNSLRSRILTADGRRHIYVNESKCPTIARGFKTAQFQKGSTYQEDETNNAQHVISAIRYYASYEYPMYGRGRVEVN